MCFPEGSMPGSKILPALKLFFKFFSTFTLFVLASVVCDCCELKTPETWAPETSAPP